MKYIFIILFIAVLMFLQIGILPHIKILGVYPNLILLAILSLAILIGWQKIIGWIIAGGLFLDIYSLNSFLGISIVVLLVVSYLAWFLSQNLFKKTDYFSIILIFLAAIAIYQVLERIILKVLNIGFNYDLLPAIIGLVYNLIFAMPIFYIIKKYVAKFRKI